MHIDRDVFCVYIYIYGLADSPVRLSITRDLCCHRAHAWLVGYSFILGTAQIAPQSNHEATHSNQYLTLLDRDW